MTSRPPPAAAAPARVQVQLQLLGAARLSGAGGQLARKLGRNDALLLALLARLSQVPRSRAAALLWPDHAPADAAGSLRQRVRQLKRAAGADVQVGDPSLALAPGVAHDLVSDETWLDAALAADPLALHGKLLDGIDLTA